MSGEVDHYHYGNWDTIIRDSNCNSESLELIQYKKLIYTHTLLMTLFHLPCYNNLCHTNALLTH